MFIDVGRPVSASRTVASGPLPTNGNTPKPWWVKYLVLATGRGRRYTEIVGVGLVRP